MSGATDGWVRTDRDGAVLTVTLDRADQLNAQTPDTWAALRAIGEQLDDDVRVVVVRGAGRAFSAGLDRTLFSAEPGVAGGHQPFLLFRLAPPRLRRVAPDSDSRRWTKP